MANILLLLPEKRGYFYRSPFLGVRIETCQFGSMVVQLPAVLPTYYYQLLNAENTNVDSRNSKIFVFNIPFFGWCNRKMGGRIQVSNFMSLSQKEIVERAENQSRMFENISIPNHDVRAEYLVQTRSSRNLWYGVQNVCRVTTTYRSEQKFRDFYYYYNRLLFPPKFGVGFGYYSKYYLSYLSENILLSSSVDVSRFSSLKEDWLLKKDRSQRRPGCRR